MQFKTDMKCIGIKPKCYKKKEIGERDVKFNPKLFH